MLALGRKVADINDMDSRLYADVIATRNQKDIVDVGRYGGSCLYGNTVRFSSIAIEEIDWMHGDARICIGPVKKALLGVG